MEITGLPLVLFLGGAGLIMLFALAAAIESMVEMMRDRDWVSFVVSLGLLLMVAGLALMVATR